MEGQSMTSKPDDWSHSKHLVLRPGIRLRAATSALAVVAALMLGAVATPSAQAQIFTTLHSFNGTDGSQPTAELVQGTDGKLYGTTQLGGDLSSCSGLGCGTVFKITRRGRLRTLYRFCSQSGCPDGQFPAAALVQSTKGTLYGTTTFGGAHGWGTVFKITPQGKLTTLYSFCSQLLQGACADGQEPNAGLVRGADGNFYGTTEGGGINGRTYGGTVFKITPSGILTTLYNFCSQSGCTDGTIPTGGWSRLPTGTSTAQRTTAVVSTPAVPAIAAARYSKSPPAVC